MKPVTLVNKLASIQLSNVFNPYSDTCPIHDRKDAAAARRRNLVTYLEASASIGTDTIWMGRDLGYRGGRRTGIALTDERHLSELARVFPGSRSEQATKGPALAERTAAEIWAVIRYLDLPPFLWNVFPFHPHESEDPLTNRKFTTRELETVDELNEALISWLGITRIVAIGQDAAQYALRYGVEVLTVRHPSYGGVREFREGMRQIYQLPAQSFSNAAQATIF